MGNAFSRTASVLEYEGLGSLLRYWQRVGRGGVPSRADIDPADIPRLLSNVILIDVERAPIRFRVRLCGTEVDRLLGRNFTGCYLDDIAAAYFERDILLDYAEVVLHKLPKVTRRRTSRLQRSPMAMPQRLPSTMSGSVASDATNGIRIDHPNLR